MTTKNQAASDEGKVMPTFTIRLLRSEQGRRSYPAKVGVTFPTEKGNHRVMWDVIPADVELRDCIMILVPYENEEQPS